MEKTQNNYMHQGLDLKRLVLVLGKKFWWILVGAVLGAILGGVTYKVVTNIVDGEPEFRASADYYITFYADGVDYYNAYTWDGILRDDPIVDYALTLLPDEITKEMVKDAVSGEMLGDYRILTVHVNASTKELANTIAKAYQDSLWHFGQEIELLDEVALWSQEEAVEFEKNNKTGNAAFLGALLAALAVFFTLLFIYVLEDACYVEGDAAKRFGLPVFGLLTEKKDAVQQQVYDRNVDYLLQENGDTKVVLWDGEIIPTTEDIVKLRKEPKLLVSIPWGRNNGRQVERVLAHLKLQDCDVKGVVITKAQDAFVKAYYAVDRMQKK